MYLYIYGYNVGQIQTLLLYSHLISLSNVSSCNQWLFSICIYISMVTVLGRFKPFFSTQIWFHYQMHNSSILDLPKRIFEALTKFVDCDILECCYHHVTNDCFVYIFIYLWLQCNLIVGQIQSLLLYSDLISLSNA